MQKFEDLIAWQKGRRSIADIYEVTSSGTLAHDWALRNQMRDAALSITSNIAEGFERNRLGEFHQFLSIAKSSCAEVRSQLYTASDVHHLDEPALTRLMNQAEEVGRLIGGLRRSIEREMERLSTLSTQHSGLRTHRACSSKT